MKVNVDLFTVNGKWKYGGVVEVNEAFPLWSREHMQDLINSQDFVTDGTFTHYYVVVSHRDDYERDPSPYFCQHMHLAGAFAGYRKEA